jgi:hypothetical protein
MQVTTDVGIVRVPYFRKWLTFTPPTRNRSSETSALESGVPVFLNYAPTSACAT